MSAGYGVVVLAAGQGTRMRSKLPKVAHLVVGKPMICHIVDAALALQPERVAVVVGFGKDAVMAALGERHVTFVEQTVLAGTADAVARCREAMAGCRQVLVLNGDSPLVTTELLARLAHASDGAAMSLVGCMVQDPLRMGIVERDPDSGNVQGIREYGEYAYHGGPIEINAGQYCFDANWLWANIGNVEKSAKGEYYLTELTGMAIAQGRRVAAISGEAEEVLGVDDRVRLAETEQVARARILRRHMLGGVTIVDPASTYIDADVELGEDVVIYPQTHLYGTTAVAGNTKIGPGAVIRSSRIGPDCVIQSAVIEDSELGTGVKVGPFCHVRGKAKLGDGCELGTYAEVKNSNIGAGVKMHHFSYMGDADIGAAANIAAGAITCNFDGVRKHRTVIGERAFIGCDTMLVAPVTIGDDAYTATGAVVIRDVAAGERVAGVPAKPLPRKQSGG